MSEESVSLEGCQNSHFDECVKQLLYHDIILIMWAGNNMRTHHNAAKFRSKDCKIHFIIVVFRPVYQ